MARERKPSVIFIDKIDLIWSVKEEDDETLRNVKTEFLVQKEGIGSDTTSFNILFIFFIFTSCKK